VGYGSRVDAIWFLKQIDWLRELGPPEWDAVRQRASRRFFQAEQTVFEPTPDPKSVYLLESGRVRIYRLSNEGAEATLGFILPGEVFGELVAFGDYRRESFAAAQVASSVWRIPADLFRSWVVTRPKLGIEVTRQMGERMKRVESRVESLIFRSVRSRLALVLFELAEDFGERNGDGLILDLGLSQAKLATLIGTTRQSVNAVFVDLKEDGVLRQDGRRLEILDVKGLRALAMPYGASDET